MNRAEALRERIFGSAVAAFRVGNAPPPLPWEPEGRADPNRALQAGFRDVQVLPIDTDYWRFYRLVQ